MLQKYFLLIMIVYKTDETNHSLSKTTNEITNVEYFELVLSLKCKKPVLGLNINALKERSTSTF